MISIIIPYFNEEKNLTILCDEITGVMKHIGESYEVLLIDNGSTDKSREEAATLSKKYSPIQPLRIRTKGKGKALAYGVTKATGDTIVFMDGDLQDNPADLPHFIEKLKNGFALVNGVRSVRQDTLVIKIYSRAANLFLKTLLHSPFTDINCGFKAMKREVLDEIPLYANNFRFLPIAAYYKGFKVTEIAVENRARKYGTTKYGMQKLYIGVIDTLNAYFLYQFSERPLLFFGSIGTVFFMIGFITALVLSFQRIFYGMLLYRRPALLFAILCIIVGIQVALTGFLGELIVYFHKKEMTK